MRILTVLLAGAVGTLGASAASAQYYGGWNNSNSYERAIYQTQQRCDRALRRADSRREYNYILQQCRQRINSLQRAYYQGWQGDWRYQDGRNLRDDDDDRNWSYWRGRDRDDDDDDD